MHFRRGILAASLCFAAAQLAFADDRLSPEDQKGYIASFSKVCRADKDARKLPKNLLNGFCTCVGTQLAKSLTLQDVVNAKLATGEERKKVNAVFGKKANRAFQSCERKL